MLDELRQQIETYRQQWEQFASQRSQAEYFNGLKPTAAGWKVKDQAEFDALFMLFRELCDQIHFGWVNERWIATFYFRGEQLPWGLRVIKLMQRRPGSKDAAGLDHMDFYDPTDADVAAVMSTEAGVRWSEEANGKHCRWVSVWFANTEAKIKHDTTLAVCASELLDREKEVVHGVG